MNAFRLSSGFLSLLLLSAYATLAEGAAPQYYTLDDFQSVEKIDAHVHLHGVAERFMAQATRDNFRVLTINVDYPDFPALRDQEVAAKSLLKRYPGRVAFAATFSVESFRAPDWAAAEIEHLEAALADGAVGVKMWKNIGMELRSADGRYVMPDDARLEPIIAMLERKRVVLLGHQAEPLNCWLPQERMTVLSDQEYFSKHPQYYMYRHPEMPSHDAILAARDRLLASHPALLFDAVHLASLEWDVDQVAAFLDRFPTARVDVAARMVHLQYQAARDHDKVRRFLTRYADRILYGSDAAYGPDDSNPGTVAEVHSEWRRDWQFLVTSDVMHSPDFKARFRGLKLPRRVADRLYRRNAEAMFPAAWNATPARPVASITSQRSVATAR